MATDWECVGIAQAGGAFVVGAAVYLFEFRSQIADRRAQYIFVGGAFGFGGSLGGGVAPSPGDIVYNRHPELWASISCERSFLADDLHGAYGALSTLGISAAYGYSLTGISAGLIDPLFRDQNVSGWGTGLGVAGVMMPGLWLRFGEQAYF